LQIEVPALNEKDLTALPDGEPSHTVRQRVQSARVKQMERQGKRNADLSPAEIDQYCQPDEAGKALLRQAISRLYLSARAYHRILKIARSIADLAGVETIIASHVAEAVQYRRLAKEQR
jgi:magnesium chelatase family protein